MRSLFDHTKKVYSSKVSFLSPTDLELTEPAQVDIIRKANLASFVSSIFGTQEIGFSELNDNFLDVFVPEGGRLLKQQGALFLELKTQAFIASMNNTERTRTELLYILFPDNLEQQLLDRRPGTRQLAPSETDFVNRAGSRRDILLGDINNEEAMKALPDKYHWEDFLRDLSSYITKNFDTINNQQVRLLKSFVLFVLLRLLMGISRRRSQKDGNHLPRMAIPSRPALHFKANFLFPPKRQRSQLTRTCTVTWLRVQLAQHKLHCRVTG